MSGRMRVLIVVIGIATAVAIGAVAVPTASGPGSPSPSIALGGRDPSPALRRDLPLTPEAGSLKRLSKFLPGSRIERAPRPWCRAFRPGSGRQIPIPGRYRNDHLLVGSRPRPGARPSDPRRPSNAPSAKCVSGAGPR
jgi:hypothetical protein